MVVVVTGGGVVTGRAGVVLTGAIVEGVEVVTAGRSVVVVRVLLPLLPVFRGGGVLVATCVAGDGPGTGVIVGVATVREGVVVVVATVVDGCVVAGCCCALLFWRLGRVFLVLVAGAVVVVVATCSGPVPVIFRATGGVVVLGLFLAVLAGDGVVIGVSVGAVLVLLALPD